MKKEDEMKKIKTLIENLAYKIEQGSMDAEIGDLIYDSRKVTKGCMFICMKGAAFDAHDAAAEVIEKGARALIIEHDIDLSEEDKKDITIIRVKDSREALAIISAAYFDHPADTLKVIGVTGTKGKTTTTYMVKSILEGAGYKVGLIGTIEAIIGDRHIHAENTTPESYTVQKYFREMLDAGCEICVMEVSSQGLMMHRVDGFTFELGIFTNLEPDHIGPNEHDTFEDYMYWKSTLFRKCRHGILNADDPHVDGILKGHTCTVETFGIKEGSDIQARDLRLYRDGSVLGITYDVSGKLDTKVRVDMPGLFSVYNSLTAIAICNHFGVDTETMNRALKQAHVKGRIEMIDVSPDFSLMIDYAHNAMALESLLSTLKEYEPKRLVCLFGCGGNRSKLRRFEMGEVSGKLADLTVITSDNPRNEEPQAIIDDIKVGIGKTDGKYVEIIDRKEAIRYVISHGTPGDIIVLAGKGHEDYQEIKGVKHPMDERDLIREVLSELKADGHEPGYLSGENS
ncbi:MAG: UDP-N-acetylmuramoyl-L-alanyl-D-glutamate--2,6-diaminopimelate ligase [Lachnospiraceae bacterium]|nr:UDP-N-acetylmuramoyl-L-alanyl-D-glutamate--2,6-diaminopimelate ligase [Lachnospiraceae bacterium]